MTSAWATVAVWCIFISISGLILRHDILLIISMPYLIYVMLPIWRNFPSPQLIAKRWTEANQISANQLCSVNVEITNTGEKLESLYLCDKTPIGLVVAEGDREYQGECRVNQTILLSYTLFGIRGKYEFQALRAVVTDYMGFKKKEILIPCYSKIAIIPKAPVIDKLQVSPRRTRSLTGLIRSRASGRGYEFFGTRPYVQGDSQRHINWKASARWARLTTNLFEQERVADIALVLDARKVNEVVSGAKSLFEYSIQATVALAQFFLKQGNRVGLLIYGSYIHWMVPGYGKRQLTKILSELTGANLGEHIAFQEFQYLPSRLFPPESQLVLISALRYQDIAPLKRLRAVGYRILIISPDPIAFELPSMPKNQSLDLAERFCRIERNAILSTLRRSGLQAIDWDVNLPLQAAIEKSVIRKIR